MYNDQLLPLLGQFLLIPNRINKFMDLTGIFSPLLLSVLLGNDEYLGINVYLAFQ